MKQFDMSNA